MRITEVVTKPRTPQKQRVEKLRTQLDAARRAAKTARLAQQQARIHKQWLKLIKRDKEKPTVWTQWVDQLQLIVN